MDGIDGIAASEAICVAGGVLIISASAGSESPIILLADGAYLAEEWEPGI